MGGPAQSHQCDPAPHAHKTFKCPLSRVGIMKKVHAIILYFFIVMAVIIGTLAYYAYQSGYVLYVGDGCPHCANVEKFLSDNNLTDKIALTKKEVYNNQSNADELMAKAAACGYNSTAVGIPFLAVNGQCWEGDGPIIKYFQDNYLKSNN